MIYAWNHDKYKEIKVRKDIPSVVKQNPLED